MKHLNVVILVMVAATALLGGADVFACSVSQFEVTDKEELPRYTFVLFYKPGDEKGDQSKAALERIEKTWAKRANADFEAIDVTSKRGVKIAKYWQVKEYPTTFVIAPTGWSLAAFKGVLDEKKVIPLLSSPGKSALATALAKHKAVFLVLGKKGMKGYAEQIKAAKAAAKTTKDTMKIETATVTVDPTDPREGRLLQNLGIEKPPKEATSFVTFGKGRAVLQDLEMEDTAERLAYTVQLLSTADQCSLGNEIRGEPLLLGK
jgi:thioredoxin-like negative regulator of GroEL